MWDASFGWTAKAALDTVQCTIEHQNRRFGLCPCLFNTFLFKFVNKGRERGSRAVDGVGSFELFRLHIETDCLRLIEGGLISISHPEARRADPPRKRVFLALGAFRRSINDG